MRQKCSRKLFILTISLLFSVSYSITEIKKKTKNNGDRSQAKGEASTVRTACTKTRNNETKPPKRNEGNCRNERNETKSPKQGKSLLLLRANRKQANLSVFQANLSDIQANLSAI